MINSPKDKVPSVPARLSRQILAATLRSMVTSGLLDQEELGSKEQVFSKLRTLLKRAGKVQLVVDHTDTLARLGDRYLQEGRHDYARLFYATFFEHTANSVISLAIERRKLPEKLRLDVLRNVNLAAKLSWLLSILELPRFSETHRQTILALAEKRNAFVHYKFTPDPRDDRLPHENKKEFDAESAAVRRAIAYARQYKARLQYGRKKKHIHAKIRALVRH